MSNVDRLIALIEEQKREERQRREGTSALLLVCIWVVLISTIIGQLL